VTTMDDMELLEWMHIMQYENTDDGIKEDE
jgi:hypothetical protein